VPMSTTPDAPMTSEPFQGTAPNDSAIPAPAANSTAAEPALSQAKTPSVPATPSADPTPKLVDQFCSALLQDAANTDASAPISDDFINTLREQFGSAPKDPFHGSLGLLLARQGIPIETSPEKLTRAMKLAGPDARGLLFASYQNGQSKIFNVKNNKAITEITDPTNSAQTPSLANTEKLWFYRTH
jgi:hypothetical protein